MARKVRNKARDTLADYWRTNRATEKANEEALRKQEEEGARQGETGDQKASGWRSLNTTERIMAVIIVLGVIGIIIRTVFF